MTDIAKKGSSLTDNHAENQHGPLDKLGDVRISDSEIRLN